MFIAGRCYRARVNRPRNLDMCQTQRMNVLPFWIPDLGTISIIVTTENQCKCLLHLKICFPD